MRAESKPPPKWITSSWPSESLCAIANRREPRPPKREALVGWRRYDFDKRRDESRIIVGGVHNG